MLHRSKAASLLLVTILKTTALSTALFAGPVVMGGNVVFADFGFGDSGGWGGGAPTGGGGIESGASPESLSGGNPVAGGSGGIESGASPESLSGGNPVAGGSGGIESGASPESLSGGNPVAGGSGGIESGASPESLSGYNAHVEAFNNMNSINNELNAGFQNYAGVPTPPDRPSDLGQPTATSTNRETADTPTPPDRPSDLGQPTVGDFPTDAGGIGLTPQVRQPAAQVTVANNYRQGLDDCYAGVAPTMNDKSYMDGYNMCRSLLGLRPDTNTNEKATADSTSPINGITQPRADFTSKCGQQIAAAAAQRDIDAALFALAIRPSDSLSQEEATMLGTDETRYRKIMKYRTIFVAGANDSAALKRSAGDATDAALYNIGYSCGGQYR